jgi:glutathione-regulated potassium-efflux system ancillary protein KefG
MPRKVLVLFAHPAFERSRLGRPLLQAALATPGVHVHDLYEAYPNLIVDVAREQALLVEHDTIVFQHPFYWYSCPSLVKEWTDQVLEHGWAYGASGTALTDKQMLLAITTGGGENSYRPEGYNRFTIRQLLAPQEQTARLCRMHFLPPFVAHDALRMTDTERQRVAQRYRALLGALVEGRVDVARADAAERIEELLPAGEGER